MSDNRAFTYQIGPVGSGTDESEEVHQSNPSWVLTVVRWLNRDTLRIKNVSTQAVLDPLIIANDCLTVTTDSSKGTLTPSFSALLKITDTNYLTAIAPGDFVFVNMLNWEAEANRIIKQVQNNQPINGFFDGFKGVFKVQGVREVISVDAESGVKTVACRLNGYAFTEFNNSIYYNPNVLNGDKDNQVLLFQQQMGEIFKNLINHRGYIDVQNIIAVLIQTFIGKGPQGLGYSEIVVQSKNTHFFIPKLVGELLNISNVTAAKDIYNYIFGVQSYSGGSLAEPGIGFNPSGMSNRFDGYFRYTQTPCQGDAILKPEYWNAVKAWSIVSQYINAPLNELYTCFRVDEDGDVMPTVVLRQMPFSTETLDVNTPTTRFLTLPRWYISPALITGLDIGRDEAARVNFVQVYAQSTFGKEGTAISFETAENNYLYDIEDVKRSGLRPYLVNSTFDEVSPNENRKFRSSTWAKIIGDALIGGHLKLNGTITVHGIVEPIAVGDNLELNDVVYHIEQVSHSCTQISESGKIMFRTTIALSSGVSVASSNQGTRYAEMSYTNAQDLREEDAKFNNLLPGVSESQGISNRTNQDVPGNQTNRSFPQPTTRIVMNQRLVKDRKKNS